MNEKEILDNSDIEIELNDLIEKGAEEILETTSLSDDLDLAIVEKDVNINDESLESVDNFEELVSENELETELDEELESITTLSDGNIENDNDEESIEDTISDDSEIFEETEEVSMLEKYILDEENEELAEEDNTNNLDIPSKEESIIDDNETDEVVEEEIEEESFDEVSSEDKIIPDIIENDSFITNDLDNINIEFGIEAKGFILSLKMMEAMIEKGYIFKDILNDKVFDAVMIFNGNLENTVMTSDIKIKIEDGKIQLIKG